MVAITPTADTSYGTPAVRSNRLHRPLLTANHVLHWLSSLIVMSIAAYFISAFGHNTHLRYWVAIAAIDVILYLPALILPSMKTYKGYLAPLALIFSYLWLTAFIFSAQDYNYNGGCFANSPAFVNKCSLKKTIEAFALLAFLTSVIGTILEARLWDINRFKGANHTTVSDKHVAPTAGVAPATTGAHPHGSAV